MTTRRKQTAPSREPGQPSPYDPVLCELARDYCMLGATNKEIAGFLGISEPTFYHWVARHQEFARALQEGREIANAKVARSLFLRATGYSHPDTHICVIEGQVVVTPIVKHYPPDTAAAFIWLQNRRPDQWRHRRPDEGSLTPEEIALEAQRAIANAMATTDGS